MIATTNMNLISKNHIEVNKINSQKARSSQYPYFPMEIVVEFLEELFNIQIRSREHCAPYSLIMEFLGTERRDNNRLSYLSSSCEYFGLVKRMNKGLQVTDLGKIVANQKNTDSLNYKLALQKSFSMPKLYKKVIERFENSKLPSNEILEEKFAENGVIQTKVKKAVTTFIKSAKFAGLLDEDNNFSQNQSERIEFNKNQTMITAIENNRLKIDNDKNIIINYPVSKGGIAQIIIPKDISEDDLKNIQSFTNLVFKHIGGWS